MPQYQNTWSNSRVGRVSAAACLMLSLACGHAGPIKGPPTRATPPTPASTTAGEVDAYSLVVESPGLYPESLAYNPADDTFLVGSVRNGTISTVSSSGAVTTLVEDPRLCSVLGIAVDTQRGRVLATNSDLGVCLHPSQPGPKRLAALGIYDLATGAALHYVDLGTLLPSAAHLANGVAMDADGNAYVSDSFAPVIYKVSVDGLATVFLQDKSFGGEGINLNGLAVHPNGYLLAIKKSDGQLFKVPLNAPQEFSQVASPRKFLGGDGLVLTGADAGILIANQAAGVAANSAYWLSSSDDWKTVEVGGRTPLGDVYPTTAAATPHGPLVLYTHLSELIAQAGNVNLPLERRAIIETIHAPSLLVDKATTKASKFSAAIPGAFVFAELHWSTPFAQSPWAALNASGASQPGFLNLTWLSGMDNHTLAGLYAFDTVENATHFITSYFPGQARKLGVSQSTRIFDAAVTQAASRAMNSVHFGSHLHQAPGAFVYTEVQVATPFDQVPWRDRNPVIRGTPGFMAKTWLSGLNTHTVGGLYAFDTVENAKAFALTFFADAAARQGAAYSARVFDAKEVADASRSVSSPFFRKAD